MKEIITKNDIIKMEKYEVWVRKPIFLPNSYFLVSKERFFNRMPLIEKGYRIGDLKALVKKYNGVNLPVIN